MNGEGNVFLVFKHSQFRNKFRDYLREQEGYSKICGYGNTLDAISKARFDPKPDLVYVGNYDERAQKIAKSIKNRTGKNTIIKIIDTKEIVKEVKRLEEIDFKDVFEKAESI